MPLIRDLLMSANRGGNGSAGLPDRDGNTELMSPASFVIMVDAALRHADNRACFMSLRYVGKIQRGKKKKILC